MLLVEQESAGRSLARARAQALDYLPGLKDWELASYILLCDFGTFELHDLEDDSQVASVLEDLPAHIEEFGFVLGIKGRSCRD